MAFIETRTNEIPAEQGLRFVMDSAEIGVWERYLIQRKLRLTEQSERLLGDAPGALGHDPQAFDPCVHPDDSHVISAAVERAIRDRTATKIKFRVIWPDGSIHWLYGLCECAFSEEGVPLRLRDVSLNITESQEQVLELKARVAHLEKMVEERTQALQLATEAKPRFLANMSHEIRNPLNSITILANLIGHKGLDEAKRHEFVSRISLATQSVTQILDGILDFSKMEAGQTFLEIAPFWLPDMIEEVREIFEAKAYEKGITFDLPPIDCNYILLGDQPRIKQVLVNLVSNALKFTHAGHVRIKTHYRKREPNSLEVIFDVTDTGIGIDPERLPTLFRPFTQADNSITRKYGGTGLGLSISKSLADLMGGRIEAKSTLGLGSTFRFSLDIPIQEDCARQEPVRVFPDTRNWLQGLNILIVDDDSNNIEIMSYLLASMGATTAFACNGLQALEQLRRSSGRFNIVLMDIQMPVMDGIEASRRIREELHLENLPIIAVSAGVLPHQQQEALSAGINEIILKPVEHQSLISALLRHYPCPDH